MQLRSSAFSDGDTIPRRLTCDGRILSPSLEWSGVQAESRNSAIICDDPGAPGGTWHHCAAYNIPTDRSGLAEGDGPAWRRDRFQPWNQRLRKTRQRSSVPVASSGAPSISFLHFGALACAPTGREQAVVCGYRTSGPQAYFRRSEHCTDCTIDD